MLFRLFIVCGRAVERLATRRLRLVALRLTRQIFTFYTPSYIQAIHIDTSSVLGRFYTLSTRPITITTTKKENIV